MVGSVKGSEHPAGLPTGKDPRVSDNVSHALWTGIVDTAREQNANLIGFVGDSLCNETGSSSHTSVLYDLASASAIDGLVSGTRRIGAHAETSHLAGLYLVAADALWLWRGNELFPRHHLGAHVVGPSWGVQDGKGLIMNRSDTIVVNLLQE